MYIKQSFTIFGSSVRRSKSVTVARAEKTFAPLKYGSCYMFQEGML